MKSSNFFLRTFKEDPAEAQIVSHRLMLRSGMIYQTARGIYTWLPLGFRVLSKIEKIIAQEQDRIGNNRILMPTVQPASLWKESGRYDGYGKEMLRIKDRHDVEMLYGPTHEEVVTDLAKHFLKSYQDFPVNFYQISWKFRDEIRPRFGVMRGREFLMKDGYSFDLDRKGAEESYKKILFSYLRTFKRMGLVAIPVRANTGPIGGNMSHEFHIMADTGESEVFYDAKFDDFKIEQACFEDLEKIYTAADEMHNPDTCPVPADRLRHARGIEVGHIFYFGTKYSKSMNLALTGKDGRPFFPEMGSYGIGVSRLVGAIIEANHDDRGIIWPESVAPFKVAIVIAKMRDPVCCQKAEELYQRMLDLNIDVLLDDRDQGFGSKMADIELIGIPYQVIVGDKAVKTDVFEWKDRRNHTVVELPAERIIGRLMDDYV